MEASSIPAAATAPRVRARPSVGPLLRLRSDEQLVKLFRAGNEDAFNAIHDRYRVRLFAYTRQMLSGSRQDAEDALQDVFVRAYGALRANDREVSLRAWLYRVAHNRCIDELRRPAPPPPETLERLQPPSAEPFAETEKKESLRRLVEDVRRLPEQQRSALLMREIVGMSYADLASALDVTVPAVKSLLVRARLGLAQAAEARDTACVEIREELTDAHDRGVRASGLVRRHLHDCSGCRAYKRELKTMRERFAALVPTLGPIALLAKLLGIGGSGAAAGSTAAGGGAAGAGAGAAGAAGAAAGGAAVAGAGIAIGGGVSAGHVAAVVAAAVVGAGGAVEVQRTLGQDKPAKVAAADVRAHVPVARQTAAAASVQATPARASAATTAARPAALKVERDGDRVQIRQTVSIVRAAPRASTVVTVPDPTRTGAETGNGNGGAAAPNDPAMELPPSAEPETLPAAPTTPTPGSPGSGTTNGNGVPPTGTGSTGTGTGTGSTGTTAPPAAPAPSTGTASGSTPPPTAPPATAGTPAPAAPATPAASGGASAAPNTAP
jgi:RNA polymerase sigma factor (sigma-70 family)